jgi:hydrogenase-4 component B
MNAAWTAALVLLAAGAVLPALGRRAAAAATLAGAVLAVVVGTATALGAGPAEVALGTWLGFGPAALRVDGLAGIFLALAGLTGGAVTLRYLERPPSRAVTGLHALVMLAVAVVVAADQAFVFLLAWETLSVALYLVASADRDRPGTLAAAYLAGGLNKLSGAALLAAFGLMYGRTGSFEFGTWQAHAATVGSTPRNVVFVLLICGFAAKIGLPPLQAGLPAAYEAAPGPAAATLSVAVVAGFAGIWRLVFVTLAPAPLLWGEAILVVGGLTALIGVLYAIAQDDIRRFLGFSTVEHSGIALIGLGAALLGQATHRPELAAAGLLAATLHVVAHAVAKTLAFLAAERIAEATGTSAMRPLGGVGRHLPRTSAGLALATLTLAAIPPFGGFVSEWFTLEALLQGFRVGDTLARLLMALAAAALALTAGLGLLAFAKMFGTVVLGRARSALGPIAEPRPPAAGLAVLAVGALLLGVAAPWEIRLLGHGLAGSLGFDPAARVISHPLVLGPVYGDFSVLAPTWLGLVLAAFGLMTAAVVRVSRRRPARRSAPWVCGTAAAPALVQYTPAAYSNPIRVVLRGVYGYRRTLEQRPLAAAGQPAVVLETRVVPLVEARLYRPLTALALAASTRARRLQSGQLGSYLAYVLAVLVVVFALIPSLRP